VGRSWFIGLIRCGREREGLAKTAIISKGLLEDPVSMFHDISMQITDILV
jgi:hypothetical protein